MELLEDAQQRTSMGRRAYDYSRAMVWPRVGGEYRRILERVSLGPIPYVAAVPKLAAIGG